MDETSEKEHVAVLKESPVSHEIVSHDISFNDKNDQNEPVENLFVQNFAAEPLQRKAISSTGRYPAKSLVISRSPSVVKEEGSEIEYTTTKKISITPFHELERENSEKESQSHVTNDLA